jgi:hypothetical protein
MYNTTKWLILMGYMKKNGISTKRKNDIKEMQQQDDFKI